MRFTGYHEMSWDFGVFWCRYDCLQLGLRVRALGWFPPCDAMMNRAGRRRRAVLPLLPLVAALGAAGLGFAPELRCPKVNGQLDRSRLCGRSAKPTGTIPPVLRQISKLDSLGFKRQQLHDAARNVAFIAAIAATIAGSWIFTGKWWKVPLGLALPSMIYRLWTTRGSTEKLAQVSASVDTKYIASTEEAQKELHMFMCSGCGYTLFPARGREGAFFNEKFKCPMCGASKDEFVDMNDDDDDGSQAEAAAAARKGEATS
eukprot:s3132_g4.t1